MDIQPTIIVHLAFGAVAVVLFFTIVVMALIDTRKQVDENIHKKKMELIEYEENRNKQLPTPKPIARP